MRSVRRYLCTPFLVALVIPASLFVGCTGQARPACTPASAEKVEYVGKFLDAVRTSNISAAEAFLGNKTVSLTNFRKDVLGQSPDNVDIQSYDPGDRNGNVKFNYVTSRVFLQNLNTSSLVTGKMVTVVDPNNVVPWAEVTVEKDGVNRSWSILFERNGPADYGIQELRFNETPEVCVSLGK